MNWFEVIFAVGQLLTLIATLPMLLDARTYVPRKTSWYLETGLAVMALSLIFMGAYLGAAVTGLAAAAWVGIYVLRGDRGRAIHS